MIVVFNFAVDVLAIDSIAVFVKFCSDFIGTFVDVVDFVDLAVSVVFIYFGVVDSINLIISASVLFVPSAVVIDEAIDESVEVGAGE